MPVSDNLEERLWNSAEDFRGQVEASEYKHIVLGMLFLRDASIRFNEFREEVRNEFEIGGENQEKLLRKKLTAENAFYIPEEARWENLYTTGKMSKKLDDAMDAIMEENERLAGRLPERFQQSGVDEDSLRNLHNEFSEIDVREDEDTDQDYVGRIYEYFIGEFSKETAQGSGEFYTPQDVVELMVESLKPLSGRIFDSCAGTGGMFVQSYEYAEKTEGYDGKDMEFYGQEINNSLVSLAEMNIFLRNLTGNATVLEGDSLSNDRMPEVAEDGERLKASKVITNPPFNYTYDPSKIENNDDRFKYGLPNQQNANYAFIQHMLHHTKQGGLVGTVMANGALANNSDKDIRKGLVEDDLVDAIITLPEKLFYTVSIPVSIFVFSKGKGKYNDDHRNREDETLFIDASDTYESVSRSENRLTDNHIEKIAMTVRKYRGDVEGEVDEEDYQDIEEFCTVATSDEIAETDYNLNPGRYISFDTETDHTPLDVKLPELRGQLEAKFKQSRELEEKITENLSQLETSDDAENNNTENQDLDNEGDKE